VSIQQGNSLELTLTTRETGAAGGNETNLLTGDGLAGDARGRTNVLVVTTTVGVVNGVHGNTTDLGPSVALALVLVVSVTGLEEGLVNTATASDDADHGAGARGDDDLVARGKLNASAVLLRVVGNDGSVATAGAGKSATVTDLGLEVADGGTLGHEADGEDVTDSELGLGTAVDGLASVETLGGNDSLSHGLVLVGVAETDLSDGGTTTRVVLNGLDDTANVAVAFGEVEGPQLGGTLAVLSVGGEDGAGTLTRGTNTTTHGQTLERKGEGKEPLMKVGKFGSK
jgi:hypothetical protein